MVPQWLYALLTTSRHAPDEMADGVLGDLLPDLYQGISELLDSLWCYLAALDALIHNLPEVLNWIQVWRTWGPVNGFNAFIVQKLPHETRYYHAPGGTHEHCTSIGCALRISSWYLTTVRVLLAKMWSSVRPSKDIPPQTITDPLPKQSCLMMLQAA